MMTDDANVLDVTDAPEILRVAEEVRATKKPCVLKRGDEEIAVIVPPRPRRRRSIKDWRPSEEDMEVFRSSAGGWKDMDVDTLVDNIYADRRASNRPPVEL